MFLKDSKTKGIQYSKLLVLICLLIAVVGIGVSIWASALFLIGEVVACAIVGLCGSLAITSVVWMLKKSQAENTMKIYLSAYEKVMQVNQNIEQASDEETLLIQQQMKEKLLSGMNNVIDIALSEATSPIEKQDI